MAQYVFTMNKVGKIVPPKRQKRDQARLFLVSYCLKPSYFSLFIYLGAGPGIWEQLSMPWAPAAALLYLVPLLAALVLFESQAERFPAVAEIQQMLRLTLLPTLRRLSWWVSPKPRKHRPFYPKPQTQKMLRPMLLPILRRLSWWERPRSRQPLIPKYRALKLLLRLSQCGPQNPYDMYPETCCTFRVYDLRLTVAWVHPLGHTAQDETPHLPGLGSRGYIFIPIL